mgnify:CR=1 FL=1
MCTDGGVVVMIRSVVAAGEARKGRLLVDPPAQLWGHGSNGESLQPQQEQGHSELITPPLPQEQAGTQAHKDDDEEEEKEGREDRRRKVSLKRWVWRLVLWGSRVLSWLLVLPLVRFASWVGVHTVRCG